MKRWLLATVAFLTLAVTANGCGDLTISDEDLDLLLQQIAAAYPLPEAGQPLSKSKNENVQGAGASNETTNKVDEADTLIGKALQTRDPYLIEDAVREAMILRPQDGEYWFLMWALYVAGHPVEGVYDHPMEGLFVGSMAHALLGDDFVSYSFALNALRTLMPVYNEGTIARQRLEKAYCVNLATYRKMGVRSDEPLEATLCQ